MRTRTGVRFTIRRMMALIVGVAALLTAAREAPWLFFAGLSSVVFLFPFWGAIAVVYLPPRVTAWLTLVALAVVAVPALLILIAQPNEEGVGMAVGFVGFSACWFVLPVTVGRLIRDHRRGIRFLPDPGNDRTDKNNKK